MAQFMKSTTRALSISSRPSPLAYVCPSCRSQPIQSPLRRLREPSARSISLFGKPKQPKKKAAEDEKLEDEKDDGDLEEDEGGKKQLIFRDESSTHQPHRLQRFGEATGMEIVGGKGWSEVYNDDEKHFEGWLPSKRTPRRATIRESHTFMDSANTQVFGSGKEIPGDHVLDDSTRTKLLAAFTELTGVRISDVLTKDVTTFRELVKAVAVRQPDKRASAFDAAAAHQLSNIPNVKVHRKRVMTTHIDKSRGREKLIVQALKERELPVHRNEAHIKSRSL